MLAPSSQNDGASLLRMKNARHNLSAPLLSMFNSEVIYIILGTGIYDVEKGICKRGHYYYFSV